MCLLGVLLFFFPCNVLAIASEALDLECAFRRTDKMGLNHACCCVSLLIDWALESLWYHFLCPAPRYSLDFIHKQHLP
jgi:hypothetical protein